MGFSTARVYFITIICVNLYAYYLYNQIANTYEKSENKCNFTANGFKVCTMLANTIMFVSNVKIAKTIIDCTDAMCKCYVKNEYKLWEKLQT